MEKLSSVELSTDGGQNYKNTGNEIFYEDIEGKKNDSNFNIKVNNVITNKLNISYVHMMMLKLLFFKTVRYSFRYLFYPSFGC